MTGFSDDQLLAALAALGISVPEDLPRIDDVQSRHSALLLLLDSEVHYAVFEHGQRLYDADEPDEVTAPFFAAAGTDQSDATRRAALANLGLLIDQTYMLARRGSSGGVLSDTDGYYDAYAEAALYGALLAQTLIELSGPKWPDKDLEQRALIEDHHQRLGDAVDTVLAEYGSEAERREARKGADPVRGPMWILPWTQLPVLLFPEAADEPAEAIRRRITDETERVLAWARTDPAAADVTVTVVKVRSQFLAVIDSGPDWSCSPAFEARGRGIAAGISAVETVTRDRWDRATPMWTASAGETDLLKVLPAEAAIPGAYKGP